MSKVGTTVAILSLRFPYTLSLSLLPPLFFRRGGGGDGGGGGGGALHIAGPRFLDRLK